jgi:hypothetical protein
MQFRYSCVDTYGKSLRELEYIIDHMRDITYQTWRKAVGSRDADQYASQMGYGDWLHIKNDWAVTFFKSRLPDKRPVYGVVHSAIEYVWY